MNVLVLGKRNLTCVKSNGDSAFIGPQRSAEITCTHGALAGKVRVRVFAVHGNVLNVGVTERGHFVAGLERVGVRVVVVVDVVGLPNGKTPASGRRTWNGLVDALHPPGKHAALREVLVESEGCVGDL